MFGGLAGTLCLHLHLYWQALILLLAGTLCWLSVLPFDVVKSRMQALDGRHYTSLVHCALDSYKKEGAKVFMRGGLAMALRAFPVNGVTFLVYEVLLDMCQNR